MQEIIVVALFLLAAVFMGRRIFKQYQAKSGCASAGCDACATDKKVELPAHFKQ